MEVKEYDEATTYGKVLSLLYRDEEGCLRHPRTQETIIGCTTQVKPKVYHKKHLGRFPTVSYHRQTNRVQTSGKFVVQPLSKAERKVLGITPTDTAMLNQRLIGDLTFKATAQYKTVWYQKHNRRQ